MRGLLNPNVSQLQNEAIDVTEPGLPVEIKVSPKGVVWVNIGPICFLRICRNTEVTVTDERLVFHEDVYNDWLEYQGQKKLGFEEAFPFVSGYARAMKRPTSNAEVHALLDRPPAVNYAILHEFADTNKIDFNELCAAVRSSLDVGQNSLYLAESALLKNGFKKVDDIWVAPSK